MSEKIKTKILKVARNKKVIKTEKDPDNWWLLTDAVKKFAEKDNSPIQANVMAEIEYDADGDSIMISRITVEKSAEAPASTTTEKTEPKKSDFRPSSSGRNESIERQCAIKSAVELVSGQQGIDINNADVAGDVVVKLADKFAKFIAKEV